MLKKLSTYRFLTLLSILIFWHLISNSITGVDGLGFRFQKLCVESIESPSDFDLIHQKVICSFERSFLISEKEQKIMSIFKNLSLIHLLVASGTHLIIIKNGFQFIFKFFTKSKWPIHLLLLVFVICSNFCCPVARSYVQSVISTESPKKSFGWSNLNLTIISSATYLLFFPLNIFSLSFWLSISASLCLTLFSKNIIMLSVGFYFALLPYIFDFNWPQMSSLFVNIFITPWLSSAFVWNSFFYIFIHNYHLIGDYFYVLIIHILSSISDISTSPSESAIKVKKYYKFIYGIIFLIFVIYFQRLKTLKIKKQILKELRNAKD